MAANTRTSSGGDFPRRPVTEFQGKHWTEYDKNLLIRLREDGMSMCYIAKRLKRTEKAVRAKLCELRYDLQGAAYKDREKAVQKQPDYSGENVETGGK